VILPLVEAAGFVGQFSRSIVKDFGKK